MNEPETVTLAEVLATRPLLKATPAADVFRQLLDVLAPLHARGEIQHALLPHAELRGELSDALGDHELIEDELRRFVEPELHAGTRTRDELVTWAFVDIRRDCLHPIGERMELPGYLEVLAGQVVDELLAHDQRA